MELCFIYQYESYPGTIAVAVVEVSVKEINQFSVKIDPGFSALLRVVECGCNKLLIIYFPLMCIYYTRSMS
jgi:hypothetical protein